jgi:hypothetical protein
MLFRRLQLELKWKPLLPYDILKQEWKYEIFEDTTKDEVEEVSVITHDREDYPDDIRLKSDEVQQDSSQNIILHIITQEKVATKVNFT